MTTCKNPFVINIIKIEWNFEFILFKLLYKSFESSLTDNYNTSITLILVEVTHIISLYQTNLNIENFLLLFHDII